MIKFSLITLFTLICICIAGYTLWTIQVSRKRSNDLLTGFRKIDRSVQGSNDSLKNNNKGVGAFKRTEVHLPEVELAIKAAAIHRRIDSMKHDLVLLMNQKQAVPFSYPDNARLLGLKTDLADYNTFIKEHFPGRSRIKPFDFVNVTDIPNGTSSIPWEIYYFKNTNVLAIITELTYVKTQVLKLQQKAVN